ncbi:MAG: hypothetical protein A3H76_00515 [Candidatus Lloydbacteria bacterium RIFCSPLOWO2_02_FULL_54_12]|nr:MAG: hypothetical protein A3H76_00515 [Candidatus Lloydbacteria bacterium RIFCSPLOWO2_02_FULL_54_12]OGZ15226.1 MAG: hypothetical protein A2948_05435 [Candidatus Lloydbacteria bacterium RIFCSPLOWO2_01_FULL_54_18]
MKTAKWNYKGVVIFGPPASGKTTLARELRLRERGVFCLEGSKVLRSFGTVLSREEARALYGRLVKSHGKTFIGKALERVALKKGGFVIASGLRGYENAVYLKERGYFVVCLEASQSALLRRLCIRGDGRSLQKEIKDEERIYHTKHIKKVAHVVFHTEKERVVAMAKKILDEVRYRECRICVNGNRNPVIRLSGEGYCDICAQFRKYFRKSILKDELRAFTSQVGKGHRGFDIMVGISGGKDSSAMLRQLQKRGFRILAFSFDTGYYPKHVFSRAARVARQLGVQYKRIDIRPYIRPIDRRSFALTAALYDEKPSPKLSEKFRRLYKEGRKHYSVKCSHALPFVRTCQLCRRVVIRAYYAEALKHGVRTVVLGINEWAHLSKHGRAPEFRATRVLKPFHNKPAVSIVHSPFLFRRTEKETKKILKKMGWELPPGEKLIETNANSCLFARAAETKALHMLGFHPDATRLSREVTAGFITKKRAEKALSVTHQSRYSVRHILAKANIL